jgi:acyl transferase domain-containing protein/acyl carrier protein
MSDTANDRRALLLQALKSVEEMKTRLRAADEATVEPIAIIGAGCRFPGKSTSLDAYWDLLRNGVDAVTEIPKSRWEPFGVPEGSAVWHAGLVEHIDEFDPRFFGISAREAASMDPQQRMILEVAWEAIEGAGHNPAELSGSSTGVFIGITGRDYGHLMRASGRDLLDVYTATGNASNAAAGRLSFILGLQGPSVSVDTACSSSLVAIHLACQSLRNRESSLALAGGVNAVITPDPFICFHNWGMMSADGRCKTFDAGANGFVRAEGCGIVVLKRLSDALADGDNILALIRGSAVNQDGRSSGLTVPNGPAQEAVIQLALEKARLQPADIDYVEAHGTGTSLGDPIEAHALASALGSGRSSEHPLVVSSVKTNIGHLESAAGVAGLIKVVLSLQNQFIPPHLHFSEMNPNIDWKGVPIEIPTQGRDWKQSSSRIRRAGVSSFGFSGTNAHIILEEAPTVPAKSVPQDNERSVSVLALSARTESALDALRLRFAAYLETHPETDLRDLCFTANAGRSSFAERAAFTATSASELLSSLVNNASVAKARTERPKLAFLFTGQGAQYPGMGQELYLSEPVFRAAIDQCAELLASEFPFSLSDLLWGSASAQLAQTQYTQPALFAIEWALAQLWRSRGVEPSFVAGHSVGEYAAACLAGVFSLADAVKLIAARARLMGSLPSASGAMLAVAAPEAVVRSAVARLSAFVSIAAVNAPDTLVVSGRIAQINQLQNEFSLAGYKVDRLPVSHAFHSAQMDEIVDAFRAVAAQVRFSAPRFPIISTVSGRSVSASELSDPGYWATQIRQPVLFQNAVSTLLAQGATAFVEIGPGSTLLGLARQTAQERAASLLWLPSIRRTRPDSQQMAETLAQLWVRGITVDWTGYDKGRQRKRIPLPTYPFERQRYWVEFSASPTSSQTPAALPAPALASDAHPLLGSRLDLAGSDSAFLWQTTLSISSLPWLAHHRVHNKVIVPMTAFLEALSAAAADLDPTGPTLLTDIVIDRPLALSDEEPVLVQIVSKGDMLEFYSREGNAWKLHASARRQKAEPIQAKMFLPAIQERLVEANTAEFYADLRQRGHDFGLTFQAVQEISAQAGEALARVEIDSTVSSSGYRLHPALLDACVQPLAKALVTEPGDSYLPMGIRRFQSIASAGPLWSHVRVASGPTKGQIVHADIAVVDSNGKAVAVFEGLELRRTTAAALARSTGDTDCFFQMAWQPDIVETSQPINPRSICSQVQERADSVFQEHRLGRYDELRKPLNQLCVQSILDALDYLGVAAPRFEAASVASKVVEGQRELFYRLLEIAVKAGALAVSGDNYTKVAFSPPTFTWSRLHNLYPDFAAELTLTERCTVGLGSVLAGTGDPLQLLFPGGSSQTAERLYSESPSAQVFNTLLAEAVKATAAATTGTLRVLEIGGGTGGTTTFAAPVLPADRTTYTYTDISPLFVARAQERFRKYPYLRFAALDIERDPETQGFQNGSYDLILAANVLHATEDLRQTMKHVRQLLTPTGTLVLLEVTEDEWWIDLTFGMTQGWWRFRDRDLRPSYPLLNAARWTNLLNEEGFANTATIQVGQPSLNTILVSTAAAQKAGEYLVVAKRGSAGERIAQRLTSKGLACTVADSAARVKELLPAKPWHGILHTAALDAPRFNNPNAVKVASTQEETCGTLLELVKVASAELATQTPQLWVLTAGAQAIISGQAVEPAQAPVWGLARTIAQEHPEFRCTAVDLDLSDWVAAVDALQRELLHRDGEQQLAWRGKVRHKARIQPAKLGSRPDLLRLAVTDKGMLENLKSEKALRRAPAPGQVEIEVEAAGIGFRDVLTVLGLYPGDPGPLGGECAGVVVSIGEGVSDFKLGDPVVAVGGGCHDGYVATDARLVAKRPESMTAEDAATLPSCLVTAVFTLDYLAKIRKGQRVLIHAGAGGVGLAAIQVAQRAGAEIFATAGSETKREFLRSLGVHHVLNSRNTDFADYVRRVTNGHGVDIVLNSLAGDIMNASFDVIAVDGTFLEIGKNGLWSHEKVAALGKNITYEIVDWSDEAVTNPVLVGDMLRRGMEDAANGYIRPLPKTVFSFSGAISAYTYMARARHIGRVILRQSSIRQVLPNASYLITGGLRGLGLEVAQWLVSSGARNLVLVGRNTPNAEAAKKIAALEDSGVRVLAMQADVSDYDALADIFQKAEKQLPPLRGVFHAAGLLDDAVLTQQTWERFHKVLAPKVEGAWNLHRLTLNTSLDFFVLFSSVASLFGGSGQSNHAAANAFEDALAHARRASGLPAISINWGSWSGTGSALRPEFEERRQALGLKDFSPKEGIALLERLLEADPPQMAAARIDWQRFAGTFPGSQPPTWLQDVAKVSKKDKTEQNQANTKPSMKLVDELAALPESKRLRAIQERVHAIAIRVLGFAEDRWIAGTQPLNELGLDSLMAVEFRNTLSTLVGKSLPATLLFSYPAIEDITQYVAEDVLGISSTQPIPEPSPRITKLAALDEISELSDEEVDRLLAAKTGGRL